jgi:MFS family permease
MDKTNLVLLTLSSGWMMIYADRLSISPLLGLIQREFNLTYSGVAVVLTAYFLAYVLVTIPAAILAERFGYKRVMVSMFLLAAVSLGLAGLFGHSLPLLILFVTIHGVGAGAYYPTAFKISTQLASAKERGFSAAIISSGMAVGLIVGLIVGGPLLWLFSNWQAILIVLAFPTGVVAFLLYSFVPSDASHRSDYRFSQIGILMKKRDFVMVCGAMFCSLYGYWVILSWGPLFLQHTRQLDIFFSGLVTGLFATISIPSSIFIGRLSDRTGRRKTALVIIPIASLAVFLMAVASNLSVMLLAIIMYGIVGKLTLDPIAVAWVTDICSSETVGTALAILNVFAMSSSIFAPLITGVLADLSGTLADGFYFGAVIILLGFGLMLLTNDTLVREAPNGS